MDSHIGVSRLMDVLADPREVLRNDALILLFKVKSAFQNYVFIVIISIKSIIISTIIIIIISTIIIISMSMPR